MPVFKMIILTSNIMKCILYNKAKRPQDWNPRIERYWRIQINFDVSCKITVVLITPNAKHLAVEQSLPVLTTWVCRGWDSNTQHSACGANALTQHATTAADYRKRRKTDFFYHNISASGFFPLVRIKKYFWKKYFRKLSMSCSIDFNKEYTPV